MSRAKSPYIVRDWWLSKRPRTPYWQITSYDKGAKAYRYASTACVDVEDAKRVLDDWVVRQTEDRPAEAENALVVSVLLMYWRERGSNTINADQTSRSMRTFLAFIEQDKVGENAVVSDLTPILFERFRTWRMGPHSFELPWDGHQFNYASKVGVKGSTVQRNINDVRAAVNHAIDNMRVPNSPKIRDLDKKYKSPPRDRVLTEDELSRILWYSAHFPELFRFVVLQMMTSVRPTAAGKFDPARQYNSRSKLIDLQPEEAPQTKKRNAIIPAVRPIRPILMKWAQEGATPVVSHKRAWRTMRKVLGLSADVFPKTIRYTIATWLYEIDWVPERQIVEVLGHSSQSELAHTSRKYAQYRPEKMGKVVKGLESIWGNISRQARRYGVIHILDTRVGATDLGYRVCLKNHLKSDV